MKTVEDAAVLMAAQLEAEHAGAHRIQEAAQAAEAEREKQQVLWQLCTMYSCTL